MFNNSPSASWRSCVAPQIVSKKRKFFSASPGPSRSITAWRIRRCIFSDPFPDTHHVTAGRINNLATAVLDLSLDRQFRSKRWHDNDILRAQIGNIGLLVFASEILDA